MMRIPAILISLLFAASAGAASAEKKQPPLPEPVRPEPGTQRQVKNRVISFSDENRASVPELHLAQGIPTTVVFPLSINEAATRLGI